MSIGEIIVFTGYKLGEDKLTEIYHRALGVRPKEVRLDIIPTHQKMCKILLLWSALFISQYLQP